jgi:hypothetical protein
MGYKTKISSKGRSSYINTSLHGPLHRCTVAAIPCHRSVFASRGSKNRQDR